MTTITALPSAPSRADPTTFSAKSDALLGALDQFVTETNTVVSEVNALAVSIGSLASGAATSIPYTFSTTTTDSDPGAGILRLDNATQNAATTIRVDLVGSDGSTWTDLLATFDDSTSTIKGFIMLQKATDATKWLLFSVSALASPSGYKNITVANVASSAASPFANSDSLLLKFQRNGDKGDTGATGPAGSNGTNGTGVPAQVTTATTATTLTSTPTLLKITPASYGVAVTLPDATTCSLGGPLHIIDNRGAYPVRVLNSAGTLLGFVFAGVVSHVSLADKSSAAGVWTVENSELVGPSAQLLTTSIASVTACIDLGSSREILIGCNAAVTGHYGVVYDRSSNTFGTPTLIRTVSSNKSAAVLSAANQVLFVSTQLGSAFEAVTLSISGTTITVNTAATATLSANISAFADGCGLIAVGSSFVCSYTVVTPAAQIRALSISGTTVTISAAAVLPGTAGQAQIAATASVVITTSTATTNFYTTPYTISGAATPSVGTGTTTSGGTMTFRKLTSLGTRWATVIQDGTNGIKAGVISLSGTTTTVSFAVMTTDTVSNFYDAIVVGANKLLCLHGASSNNVNIMTDTAGTASAGTAATGAGSGQSLGALFVDGTTAYLGALNSPDIWLSTVDCSGASPVVTYSPLAMANTVTDPSAYAASNTMLSRSPKRLHGTKFVRALNSSATNTITNGLQINNGDVTFKPITDFLQFSYNQYRGRAPSEVWVADGSTKITKLECVA